MADRRCRGDPCAARREARLIRVLLAGWIGVCSVLIVAGLGGAPGLPALRSWQGWWLARNFEAAAATDDLDALARLGPLLQERAGADEALLFAAHRIGFQVTGESYGLAAQEAAAWADAGWSLLQSHISLLQDPWSALEIQAIMLVQRDYAPLPIPFPEEPLGAWTAAGGSPDLQIPILRRHYRDSLARPLEERSNFLLKRLREGIPAGD